MDDPLSAVDAHVGKHLFQHCIQGFLKDKSVILVTHQLQYLQDADEIIVLKQGNVEERGSFQHLLKNGMDFSSFLAQEGEDEDEDEHLSPDNKETKNLVRMRTLSMMSESPSIISNVSQAAAFQDIQIKNGCDIIKSDNIEKENSTPEPVKEERSSGSVKFKVYKDYIRSGGNWFAVIFLLFMNILCQVLYSGSDIWLSFWTGEEEKKLMRLHGIECEELHSPVLTRNATHNNETSKMIHFDDSDLNTNYFNLGIYGAIVGALAVTSLIRTVYFFVLSMRSSVNLHDQIFQSIIRAP